MFCKEDFEKRVCRLYDLKLAQVENMRNGPDEYLMRQIDDAWKGWKLGFHYFRARQH